MAERIVNILFEVLKMAIIAEVIISWIPNGRNSKIWYTIRAFTAPLMEPSEKISDKFLGNLPIDISPIIAYGIASIIQSIILVIVGII